MKRFLPVLLLFLLPQLAFAGSQSYTTPGTYTFTVPSYGTLTVTVSGAGGGGEEVQMAPLIPVQMAGMEEHLLSAGVL